MTWIGKRIGERKTEERKSDESNLIDVDLIEFWQEVSAYENEKREQAEWEILNETQWQNDDIFDIYLSDIVEFLKAEFGFIYWEKTDIPDMYKFSGEMPYYISLKIPPNYKKGKAIHVNVRIILNGSDYNVYPLVSEKKGRGRYISKSIHRTKNWKKNLKREIETGIKIAKEKYNLVEQNAEKGAA